MDLQTGQSLGNSWVTLFSPPIPRYAVSLEPMDPAWSVAPADNQRNAGDSGHLAGQA